jgi:hypothetical protein
MRTLLSNILVLSSEFCRLNFVDRDRQIVLTQAVNEAARIRRGLLHVVEVVRQAILVHTGCASASTLASNFFGRLSGAGDALYSRPLDLWRTGLAGLPEVVSGLLRNPGVRMAAILDTQPSLKAQGHCRGYCRPAIEDTRKRSTGYAKLGSGFRHRQAQGGQDVFP